MLKEEKFVIYFTSDLHFSHTNIIKHFLIFRFFNNADEMDEFLIKLWNKRVKSDDIVYDLGDFSFSMDYDRIFSILDRLNGKHKLILGNHDSLISTHKNELLRAKKQDGNTFLDEICEYKELELSWGGEKYLFILFHYPIAEWNKGEDASIHLYGHLHDKIANLQGKALNVGYDLHGKILSIDEILEFLQDIKPFAYGKKFSEKQQSVKTRAKSIKEFIVKNQ